MLLMKATKMPDGSLIDDQDSVFQQIDCYISLLQKFTDYMKRCQWRVSDDSNCSARNVFEQHTRVEYLTITKTI